MRNGNICIQRFGYIILQGHFSFSWKAIRSIICHGEVKISLELSRNLVTPVPGQLALLATLNFDFDISNRKIYKNGRFWTWLCKEISLLTYLGIFVGIDTTLSLLSIILTASKMNNYFSLVQWFLNRVSEKSAIEFRRNPCGHFSSKVSTLGQRTSELLQSASQTVPSHRRF